MDFRTTDEINDNEKLERSLADKIYMEDLNELLSLDSGKRFFKEFIKGGRVFNATFTGNSSVYFKEGKRALVLEYIRDLQRANPKVLTEIFLDIIKEESEDDSNRN